MYNQIKNYFCARTGGKVHCKNLSLIENVKIVGANSDDVYVQIILLKNDKPKLIILKPSFVSQTDRNYVNLRFDAPKGCIDQVIANFGLDVRGNETFSVSLLSQDSVKFTTFNHVHFHAFVTLDGVAVAQKI